MKEWGATKKLIVISLALVALVLVFGSMAYSARPMNEATYLAMINRNDRDIKNVDHVDIQVDHVEQVKPIGWVVYGKAGGAWVSSSKPPISKDNTLAAIPQSYRYVVNRWVITYTFPRGIKK